MKPIAFESTSILIEQSKSAYIGYSPDSLCLDFPMKQYKMRVEVNTYKQVDTNEY
ncbi:hypothetical protein [Rossellomorea aquimaris]|uniref:hypothetical protein n=1 Tax=Rossellomorea aquimaris TaxID=189382 RepID=UPI001653CCAE|nr:hypothetical protein [Rossellomorea aquimaris]